MENKYAILYTINYNDMDEKYREYTMSPVTIIRVEENDNSEFYNEVHGKIDSIINDSIVENEDIICIGKPFTIHELVAFAKDRYNLSIKETEALKFYFDIFKYYAVDGLYNRETLEFKAYDRIDFVDENTEENDKDFIPFTFDEIEDLYSSDTYKELITKVNEMRKDHNRTVNPLKNNIFIHKDILITILKLKDKELCLYELYKMLQQTYKDIKENNPKTNIVLPSFGELMEKSKNKDSKIVNLNFTKRKKLERK